MSENQYQRNPSVRVLASELRKSDYHFKETDKEKAPNYLLLPSGDKANRIMMGGTLVGIEDISDGSDPYWRARVNDGTGEFAVYAGQYQPEVASKLQELNNDPSVPPAYVNVVGKTREYRPEGDEGEVIISIKKPEYINVVTSEHRDNLLREAAEQTIERLEKSEGEYVRRAEERYGDRVQLLKDDVLNALESIESGE